MDRLRRGLAALGLPRPTSRSRALRVAARQPFGLPLTASLHGRGGPPYGGGEHSAPPPQGDGPPGPGSVKHPDAPGAWIANAKNSVRHPEPAEDTLVRVMGSAADVVEKNATRDPADPYVLAMALELVECYPDRQILLVTNDVVDRLPLKISVRTACGRLGLLHCPPEPFLTWLQGDEGAPLTHEDVVIPAAGTTRGPSAGRQRRGVTPPDCRTGEPGTARLEGPAEERRAPGTPGPRTWPPRQTGTAV